jgi:hypothetical protein
MWKNHKRGKKSNLFWNKYFQINLFLYQTSQKMRKNQPGTLDLMIYGIFRWVNTGIYKGYLARKKEEKRGKNDK